MLALHDASEADAKQHAIWQVLTCNKHTIVSLSLFDIAGSSSFEEPDTSGLDICPNIVVSSPFATFDHLTRCGSVHDGDSASSA